MSTASLAILLFAAGIALMLAELLLPTHGLLGILGLIGIGGGIGACFYINQWLGLGVFLGSVLAAPFAAAGAVKLWPKTPVGKRMLLPPVQSRVHAPEVRIGQVGVAITPLRPMGECEFADGKRWEALSEYGMIEPGEKVQVVALVDNRLTVRLLKATDADRSSAA